MPLTAIQAEVLSLIAVHRSPESYLAGATVIHRAADTPRFSQDLDFFHDVADSIAQSADRDAATLQRAGYEVLWLLRTTTFHRAVVTASKRQLRIEWAQDSAFRFFPVQEDERFGYRLHDADAAVNKVLALAGRDEIRDFVDVLHLHKTYLSLGAMAWAACGKDPGFTPDLLLDHAGRHAAYTGADTWYPSWASDDILYSPWTDGNIDWPILGVWLQVRPWSVDLMMLASELCWMP